MESQSGALLIAKVVDVFYPISYGYETKIVPRRLIAQFAAAGSNGGRKNLSKTSGVNQFPAHAFLYLIEMY